MALILTPGQLSQRADFYLQLGQLTGAGLGLVRALEQLKRNPPAPSYRRPIEQVLDGLAGGCTLTESLQGVDNWLPVFDTSLLRAGEESGRLEACFRSLTDYYRVRARLARGMIGDLLWRSAKLSHLCSDKLIHPLRAGSGGSSFQVVAFSK